MISILLSFPKQRRRTQMILLCPEIKAENIQVASWVDPLIGKPAAH